MSHFTSWLAQASQLREPLDTLFTPGLSTFIVACEAPLFTSGVHQELQLRWFKQPTVGHTVSDILGRTYSVGLVALARAALAILMRSSEVTPLFRVVPVCAQLVYGGIGEILWSATFPFLVSLRKISYLPDDK